MKRFIRQLIPHRFLRVLAIGLCTLGLLVACNTQSPVAESEPAPSGSTALAVGSSPWPGFAGHYVAVAQALFKAEGIEVVDNYFQIATDVNTALLAGQLDLAWTGVPDMVVMASEDPSLRLIMMSDYSNGADGILARGVSSPADLQGKDVAWETLPLQALLLQKYLEQSGLTQDDINLQVIAAAEAASAFAAGKIDVAVTYEPWLSTAVKEGEGEVIFSSKDTNIIPVGLVAKESVIADRKEDILAFMRAIDKAMTVVRDNPEETNAIVAEKLGIAPEDVPAQLETVRLFDLEENKSIVFNPDDPLNVMDSLEFAAKTSADLGLITAPVDAKTLYDDSLVNSL